MTLRKKTLIIMITMLFAITTVLFVTLRMVLHSGFSQLEVNETRRNAVRAANALNMEILSLDTKVHDWAAWDDTYQFIVDRNKRYFESNLVRDSFNTLTINFMIYLDAAGEMVFSKGFDLTNDLEIPVPESLMRIIREKNKFILRKNPRDFTAGVVVLPEGPLMLSARPILTTDEKGPSRGALIFARYIGSDEIARLSEMTQLAIDIRTWGDSSSPADFAAATASLTDTNLFFVRSLSEKTIAGYALVGDITRKPALIIRASMPRDIHDQERRSTWYLLLVTLFTVVVSAAAMLILLERSILSRLAELSRNIVRIGSDGDFTGRVTVSGKDELSSVALASNRMLAALEESHNRITHRNREMRTIMNNVKIGLLSLDRDFHVNPEYSKSAEDIFGVSGLTGRPYLDLLGFTTDRLEDREKLREYLDLIREGSIPIEDLAPLNPFDVLRLERGLGRFIWVRTSYYLMHDEDETRRCILAELEDITGEKELAEQVMKSEAETVQIMAIVENPEMYREFLVQVNETLDHLRTGVREMTVSPAVGDRSREILREVHTLKGTSSAFGAYAIAGLAGEIEDALSGIHTFGTAESGIRKVERILACLLREFEAVRDRAASILGDDVREDTEPYLRVPLRELKLLQETARRISGEECRELARRLKAICMVPVGKGLGRAFRIADDLVDRTRKSVEIRFEGGDILIEYEIARELNTPILHLFRNAIRHGIEDPAERIAAGKPERGLVMLTVRNFNGTLMVEFSDDGSGLDPERIRMRAMEKLFISAEEAERLTPEECLNLIFTPGFTTTENLDAISGRGMGLDVVRSAIMKLNGRIEIDRTTRVGTKFVITIPLSSDD